MKKILLFILSIMALSLSLCAQTKTYGTILYNGISVKVDDKLLSQLLVSASYKDNIARMTYADIVDALRSGKNVSYNSATNTITGVNFKRIDRKIRDNVNATREYSYKRSKRIKDGWATRNSPEHQFIVAIQDFGREIQRKLGY